MGHCYLLPDTPALSGSFAYDWNAMYLFYESADVGGDGDLYYLNNSNFRGDAINGGGWSQVENGIDGGYGRKVFIRGNKTGSGCWFSTDILAEDIWVYWVPGQTAHNNISISWSANGPWRTISGAAPWTPRVAAALATTWSANVAWLGSGMDMVDGFPQLPSYGDVWQIDVGVCLLDTVTGSPKVCNGRGTPNLVDVTCVCDAGFSGTTCQIGSAPSPASSAKPSAAGITFAVLIPLSIVGFVFYAGGPAAALTLSIRGAKTAQEWLSAAVQNNPLTVTKSGVPSAKETPSTSGSSYGAI